mmetsp:Transcript_37845/g.83318  ORF Transcript_37845/g.83318 Transcript_37845/m.83318 type:complete len:254 (-) Transcript_37845:1165-1926(-)
MAWPNGSERLSICRQPWPARTRTGSCFQPHKMLLAIRGRLASAAFFSFASRSPARTEAWLHLRRLISTEGTCRAGCACTRWTTWSGTRGRFAASSRQWRYPLRTSSSRTRPRPTRRWLAAHRPACTRCGPSPSGSRVKWRLCSCRRRPPPSCTRTSTSTLHLGCLRLALRRHLSTTLLSSRTTARSPRMRSTRSLKDFAKARSSLRSSLRLHLRKAGGSERCRSLSARRLRKKRQRLSTTCFLLSTLRMALTA